MAEQRKRVHCPHCNEYVSRSIFYQHKQLYFDDFRQRYTDHDYPHQITPIAFEFAPDGGYDCLSDTGTIPAILYEDDDESKTHNEKLYNDKLCYVGMEHYEFNPTAAVDPCHAASLEDSQLSTTELLYDVSVQYLH